MRGPVKAPRAPANPNPCPGLAGHLRDRTGQLRMVLSLLPVVLALLSRPRPSVQRLVLCERPGVDDQCRVVSQSWIARHRSLARLHPTLEDHSCAIDHSHCADETVSTPWDIVDDCHGHTPLCAPSGADRTSTRRPQRSIRASRSEHKEPQSRFSAQGGCGPVGHGLDGRARSS